MLIDLPYFIGAVIVCMAIEWAYFFIARRYGIIDKPNQRSSHSRPTIRGAGILFPVIVLFWFIVAQSQAMFVVAIVILAAISFMDDIQSIYFHWRMLAHFFGVGLIFLQTDFFVSFDWFVVVCCFVVAMGVLSAFNFMDGINGITGIYCLSVLLSLLIITPSDNDLDQTQLLIWAIMAGLIAFLFFNFRKKAVCFAGDVGSITLAAILIYVMLQVMVESKDLRWIVLVSVYGIDSVVTILFRLKKRENIFQPHRTHLYQYLANENRLSHRAISLAYGLIQFTLNFVFIEYLYRLPIQYTFTFVALQLLVYLVFRISVLKKIETVDA